MHTLPLFQFTWCALLALVIARYVGDNKGSDFDAVTAIEKRASTSYNSAINLDDPPECANLKHRVDEDPRWNFETAHLAKCECWRSKALLKCKVTIPNDHIFDEQEIANSPDECGRSVYNAVSRWSLKSGHDCALDHENVARVIWRNGIGTSIKRIKKGFDEGTCGQFKDVQCHKLDGPSD